MTGARHQVTRIRRETRRRNLTVSRVERLSEAMLRVWLEGEDLHDFESAGADDHVKLFVDDGRGGQAMRDYTPRYFDTAARTLAIDFALHGEGEGIGPATRWAMEARPGTPLQVGGPRGSSIVRDDFDWVLLIGDETAFPAIGRRIEELRADVPVLVVAMVQEGVERPPLPSRTGVTVWWIDRRSPLADANAVVALLEQLPLPPGEGFVWIAAEGDTARVVRSHMIDVAGHPRSWTKASGYWLAGADGHHVKLGD
jgi:NADPH-dependent ferric siderophore reductase